MLGMLGGLAEVVGGDHELVFFGVTGPRNADRVRVALDGIRGRQRILVVPPPSNPWRKLWSRAQRIPVERFVGPHDVRPRPRAAPPPGVGRFADPRASRPEGSPRR